MNNCQLLLDKISKIGLIMLQRQTALAHNLVNPSDVRDGVLSKYLRLVFDPLFGCTDRFGIIAIDCNERDWPHRNQNQQCAGGELDP